MNDVPVACCQLAPVVGDGDGNRQRALAAIVGAVDAGAEVIVLPELAVAGYVFRHRDEVRAAAEDPHGPTVESWCELSRRHGVVVIAGFAERGGPDEFFNSGVVIDRGDVLHVYRKVHLWGEEPSWFQAGDRPPAVVETSRGRVGLAICYDIEFPEVGRGLALAGAQLLAYPTNWPQTQVPRGARPMLETLAMSTAYLNRVFVAVCDRSGNDRGLAFEGASVIAGHDGQVLTRADNVRIGELMARCNLEAALDKTTGPHNNAFADRRPHLYRAPTLAAQPEGIR